ncbi:hypothetical protein BO78DRAFT_245429 [Aspergillus sclerotiicarbonarius CBS 121057]|uniref:Uncharacterized protein n=1 Tax=Aspergillus sclerotiicarbonarius (strain CBS 121057 / IBT 28362) TaxID=1448318 RepID=A0A319DZU4_ASPSB|nr:hypothetical protein BO78DRAFT_245429 [Aspergillus sclerotiicarbonarius CBS 121057]
MPSFHPGPGSSFGDRLLRCDGRQPSLPPRRTPHQSLAGRKLWSLRNHRRQRRKGLNQSIYDSRSSMRCFIILDGRWSSSGDVSWRKSIGGTVLFIATWEPHLLDYEGGCVSESWSRMYITGYFHGILH